VLLHIRSIITVLSLLLINSHQTLSILHPLPSRPEPEYLPSSMAAVPVVTTILANVLPCCFHSRTMDEGTSSMRCCRYLGAAAPPTAPHHPLLRFAHCRRCTMDRQSLSSSSYPCSHARDGSPHCRSPKAASMISKMLAIMYVISVGAIVASIDEITIDWVGVVYQMGGVVAEALRLIFIEIFLKKTGVKLNLISIARAGILSICSSDLLTLKCWHYFNFIYDFSCSALCLFNSLVIIREAKDG
jgi:hypothetical protein